MPSSTSSFESASSDSASIAALAEGTVRPGFVRLTASDRPGVAQPVPERDIPPQPWQRIFPAALLLATVLLAAWEWHWRDFGATPGTRNSDGLWAQQRRRIDQGEGDALVLLGSSRTLSDVQLATWQRLSGRRPIQLALEGTSPLIPLEQLADDADFTGTALVDVTPQLFGMGANNGGFRASAFKRYRDEGPSQRIGQWLSQRVLEPWLAFYEPDFALDRIVRRLPWPARAGLPPRPTVRKLFVFGPDRNARLWHKLTDPAYLAIARDNWVKLNWGAPPPDDAQRQRQLVQREDALKRVVAAVAKLRARGATVLFVRHPVEGPYREHEDLRAPRAETWDALLARSGAPGISFEDHSELQGFELPEWSHMSATAADRYTEALYRVIEREQPRWLTRAQGARDGESGTAGNAAAAH